MERLDASTSRVLRDALFRLSVGSSSGGHDQSEGLAIAINRDCYNSLDGWLRLFSILIESASLKMMPRTP